MSFSVIHTDQVPASDLCNGMCCKLVYLDPERAWMQGFVSVKSTGVQFILVMPRTKIIKNLVCLSIFVFLYIG
jgi:hypothetical protein